MKTRSPLLKPSESESWRRLYPFESNFFSRDSVRQHFIDHGSGEPILFVHGNPTWSFYFRDLIGNFATNHRCVAVDHIGCGLSDKPVGYAYHLQQHIDNLVALITQLDLTNVTLVAHDWGGAIGLGTLLNCQQRFKRIILLNTGAFPPPYIPFRIQICRWPILGQLAVQGFNAFSRSATFMATEQLGGLSKEIADGMLFPYDNWNRRTAIYQFVKDIPAGPTHRTWSVLSQIEKQLPSITMPKKLIWGMKDWCFRPDCLERFLLHWPDADVTRIADAGHYVVEDATDVVIDSISNFLKK